MKIIPKWKKCKTWKEYEFMWILCNDLKDFLEYDMNKYKYDKYFYWT